MNVEDIYFNFSPWSLVLSLIISWTFRTAHEEDQYSYLNKRYKPIFCLLHSYSLKLGLGVRELLFQLIFENHLLILLNHLVI